MQRDTGLEVKNKIAESFFKTLEEIKYTYDKTLIDHIETSINNIETHIDKMKNYILKTSDKKESALYHSHLNIENGITLLFTKIKNSLNSLKNNSSQKNFSKIVHLKNIILNLYEKLSSIIGIQNDLKEKGILKPYSDILECLKNIFILPPSSK